MKLLALAVVLVVVAAMSPPAAEAVWWDRDFTSILGRDVFTPEQRRASEEYQFTMHARPARNRRQAVAGFRRGGFGSGIGRSGNRDGYDRRGGFGGRFRSGNRDGFGRRRPVYRGSFPFRRYTPFGSRSSRLGLNRLPFYNNRRFW